LSFLYPRTVSISRPHANPTTDVGDQGYNAERGAADETVLATDLPASIQLDRQGQRNGEGLPTDARYQAIYKVFIPKSAAALGSIKSADVVTDDQGVRYQVFSPYWDSLGYRLGGIVLEV
jgi:hypothetical protein